MHACMHRSALPPAQPSRAVREPRYDTARARRWESLDRDRERSTTTATGKGSGSKPAGWRGGVGQRLGAASTVQTFDPHCS